MHVIMTFTAAIALANREVHGAHRVRVGFKGPLVPVHLSVPQKVSEETLVALRLGLSLWGH